MAAGSSGRSPQRRTGRPAELSLPSSTKRSAISSDRAASVRRRGRVSSSRFRQATVLFLAGAVCLLALFGYGSVLTGINTSSGKRGSRRPGKGGQGAIYGARGGGSGFRQGSAEYDARQQSESMLQSSYGQGEAPNQSTNDDEIPAKPDNLIEIGQKAQRAKGPAKGSKPRKSEAVAKGADSTAMQGTPEETACSFRRYPPHRLYGLDKHLNDQPDFLTKASYIRGELPVTIGNVDGATIKPQASTKKICVDSSSWDPPRDGHGPFSDGQNPSIASLASNPYSVEVNRMTSGSEVRLDPHSVSAFEDIYGPEKTHEMYLGVTLAGNAQCKWKMNEEMTKDYGFSALNKAPDHRTLVLVLDGELNTKGQATLMIERDAVWGKTRRALKAQAVQGGKGYERSVEFFDDPRIFFYNGEPYVLYRQGPKFGYEDQIQNRLHFEVLLNENGSRSFVAYVKASETFTVCCGRNIALMSDDGTNLNGEKPVLRALTWVDPITVVDVDTGTGQRVSETKRRLLSTENRLHRQLRSGRRKKSNIHGTNGYMVPLHSTSEVLGIAHFHRPEDRATSDYALHGHHYTHALFTIARVDADKANSDEGGIQYRLKRISNEFAFQSMSIRAVADGDLGGQTGAASSQRVSDADIIQFASGLDLIGTDTDGQLLISYGINDCEGAAVFLDMKDIQKMLIDVPEGKQVVDLMALHKT
mmetsp:Transcript_47760/g.144436  ORF Transcript_47760/g.144436 Transcript_47760/m.144436 type:complete len:701 (-) Transcript_47760:262-2364(-)